MAARAKAQAEALAATLPPLLLAAERVAATVAQGVHGRRRTGIGETFWQFRHYTAEDSAQRIDWRQSAKAESLFVRQNEWEAAQSVWIWRDASPSMAWRSAKSLPTKRERAELLVLALAALMVDAGEHLALLGGRLPPAGGRARLERLAIKLAGGLADTAEGLPPIAPLPRHGQIVLAGDFLAEPEAIEARLRALAGRGVRGHVLQVLDPAEESLPWDGRIRFDGLEDEAPVVISRVDGVRDAYQHRLHAHCAALRDLCRRLGWGFTSHRTDHPPHTAVLAAHVALSGRIHG